MSAYIGFYHNSNLFVNSIVIVLMCGISLLGGSIGTMKITKEAFYIDPMSTIKDFDKLKHQASFGFTSPQV